ncbi:MAG: SH3 domain-containing protein [Spirochaetales bacterium]|nr:SH3 domain-containing protein [Spirochaetales bacterium]
MVRYSETFRVVLLFLFLPLFSFCSREDVVLDIELPPTPILSIKTSWGVITSSHLRLREEPNLESRAITTLWRGYVLEIVSQGPEKETVEDGYDYWYRINFDGLQGWVFGSYLDIFDSRDQAETAAREMQ